MWVTFKKLWIVREFITICLEWFGSVRDAFVVINFPSGCVVSLHVFNARVCALCVRTPHFCDVKVPLVFNAFSAFSFCLVLCFFNLVSCSLQDAHTRKEAFGM